MGFINILRYKDWEKIVTHGPDGQNHIHHIKTYNYVTKIAKECHYCNILYYFGKYYNKHNIPKDLPKIRYEYLEFKQQELSIYKNIFKSISRIFGHMLPYENLILSSKC